VACPPVNETRAVFVGAVRCVRTPPPLGLTLAGTLRGHPGEDATLAFAGVAPADCPELLRDAEVEPLEGGGFALRAAGRVWRIDAPYAHLHRCIDTAFYAALPPRPVPLAKRLLWRLVLALAASRAGPTLLRRLGR